MARQFATANSDHNRLFARLTMAPLAGVVSMLYALRRISPSAPANRVLVTLVLCTLIAAVNTTLFAAFAVWRRQIAAQRRIAMSKPAQR